MVWLGEAWCGAGCGMGKDVGFRGWPTRRMLFSGATCAKNLIAKVLVRTYGLEHRHGVVKRSWNGHAWETFSRHVSCPHALVSSLQKMWGGVWCGQTGERWSFLPSLPQLCNPCRCGPDGKRSSLQVLSSQVSRGQEGRVRFAGCRGKNRASIRHWNKPIDPVGTPHRYAARVHTRSHLHLNLLGRKAVAEELVALEALLCVVCSRGPGGAQRRINLHLRTHDQAVSAIRGRHEEGSRGGTTFRSFLKSAGPAEMIPWPEIRAVAAERALDRQTWRDAIKSLAPLEFKKPQQPGSAVDLGLRLVDRALCNDCDLAAEDVEAIASRKASVTATVARGSQVNASGQASARATVTRVEDRVEGGGATTQGKGSRRERGTEGGGVGGGVLQSHTGGGAAGGERAQQGATWQQRGRLVLSSVPDGRLVLSSVPDGRLVLSGVPDGRLVLSSVPDRRLVLSGVPDGRLVLSSVPDGRL
eukprot:359677-Chlamydomonas_euryale.AAC.1